jgi:hypothetical protein
MLAHPYWCLHIILYDVYSYAGGWYIPYFLAHKMHLDDSLFRYLTMMMMYNRCTGIYKFWNITYPRRIRCRSNLGNIFREKCVLWAGRYSMHTTFLILNCCWQQWTEFCNSVITSLIHLCWGLLKLIVVACEIFYLPVWVAVFTLLGVRC